MRHSVRIPLGQLGPEYSLVNFEPTTYEKCHPDRLPTLSPSACVALPGLSPAFDSRPTKPSCTSADVARTGAALVTISVASYSDRQQIDFAFNHVLCDAKGMGMYFHAFSCELNGRPWTAPELDETSRVNAAYAMIRDKIGNQPAVQPKAYLQPGGIWPGLKPFGF